MILLTLTELTICFCVRDMNQNSGGLAATWHKSKETEDTSSHTFTGGAFSYVQISELLRVVLF